tara:strand:- start:242 stop:760 length:519 start_codon:yes stop_codon:yes gene_type:complete
MKKKILPFLISLTFVIIFIIFYIGLEDAKIYIPKNTAQYEISEFDTKEYYSGSKINSKEIFELDKTYLLNIWSSWCVPCRHEHPLLMNLKGEDKLNIVGLNYKDDKNNADNFLKELGNPYKKIFIDLDGTIAIELGAYGVPESFLIYNNKIIKKYIGPLNKKLINEIKEFVK